MSKETVQLTKPQAKALKGRHIEIYWDGESEWYEAEVLAYDEARRVHFVRYSADGYECEESLNGGPNASPWRSVIKTTARGAAVKAAGAAQVRAALGSPQ